MFDLDIHFDPFGSWVGAARFQRHSLDVAAASRASFAPPRWYLEKSQWPRNSRLAFRVVPPARGQLFAKDAEARLGRKRPPLRPWQKLARDEEPDEIVDIEDAFDVGLLRWRA